MENVIRKRVTRVGSGAWSIYLPKKWIDQWEPEQQEGREVDLRAIGPGMLITPAVTRTRLEHTVDARKEAVITWLLSSYLRGYDDVTLHAAGPFDHDTIAATRDFLRHLDERLEARCSADAIGFQLRAELPPAVSAGEDLLHMLAIKVDEVLALAHDALSHHPHDPDRVLHNLRLLRDTQEEDVARLFHQAMRLVATLEIPMPSVSDYQLLGLAAADLHRIGEQAMRMAGGILAEYNLTAEDLDYPRAHLMESLTLPPARSGLVPAMLRAAVEGFAPTRELLGGLTQRIRDADIEGLAKVGAATEEATERIRQRLFAGAGEYWGAGGDPSDAQAALVASRHTTSIVVMLDHIRAIANTAAALLAADPRRLA